jgi:hypothetical protein
MDDAGDEQWHRLCEDPEYGGAHVHGYVATSSIRQAPWQWAMHRLLQCWELVLHRCLLGLYLLDHFGIALSFQRSHLLNCHLL